MDRIRSALQRRRVRLAAAALVVVVAGALIYGLTLDRGTGDEFDRYAGVNESAATTDSGDAEVAATVNITGTGVSPVRVEIGIGEAVRFRNTHDTAVRVVVDRSEGAPRIEPGGSATMRFRAISHYTVTDTGSGEEIATGTVYVN